MTIASVGWGAAAVGGDEESGQLELTLAHGVTRIQVVLERALSLFLRVVLLAVMVFVLVRLLNDSAQLDIRPGNLFGAAVLFAGLALLSGTAALCAGQCPEGGRTAGRGAAVGVLGYVFNAVGRQSEDVAWLLDLSPYHWLTGIPRWPTARTGPRQGGSGSFGGAGGRGRVRGEQTRRRHVASGDRSSGLGLPGKAVP
ncbi:conserved hypothetical protein [Arthrobacter sp. Hiyo4]|nr:conserved hypothetical protein [Arthrobacter sp. Hiyo4]